MSATQQQDTRATSYEAPRVPDATSSAALEGMRLNAGGIQPVVAVSQLTNPAVSPDVRDAVLLNAAQERDGSGAFASAAQNRLAASRPTAEGSRGGMSAAQVAAEIHSDALNDIRGRLTYADSASAETIAHEVAAAAANAARAIESQREERQETPKGHTSAPWQFRPAFGGLAEAMGVREPERDQTSGTFDPFWIRLQQAGAIPVTAGTVTSETEGPGKRLEVVQVGTGPSPDSFRAALSAFATPSPNRTIEPTATTAAEGLGAGRDESRFVPAQPAPGMALADEPSPQSTTAEGGFRLSRPPRGHTTFVRAA